MVSAVSGPGVQITTAATGTKATNSVSMITSFRRATVPAQSLIALGWIRLRRADARANIGMTVAFLAQLAPASSHGVSSANASFRRQIYPSSTSR
jgi:hypothetical protein